MKSYIRKIADAAMIGGVSAMVIGVLAGCNNQESNTESTSIKDIKNGAFVILEEQGDGKYKVLEEYPSAKTHIVVRDKAGNERVLSEEEIEELLKEEEARIDNGTSDLTKSPESIGSGGMSLGGAILASAAGALIGSYIGNKLFNNQNYQQNKQRSYKSPQAYERSTNNFKNQGSTAAKGATPSNSKKGFFGGGQTTNNAG